MFFKFFINTLFSKHATPKTITVIIFARRPLQWRRRHIESRVSQLPVDATRSCISLKSVCFVSALLPSAVSTEKGSPCLRRLLNAPPLNATAAETLGSVKGTRRKEGPFTNRLPPLEPVIKRLAFFFFFYRSEATAVFNRTLRNSFLPPR